MRLTAGFRLSLVVLVGLMVFATVSPVFARAGGGKSGGGAAGGIALLLYGVYYLVWRAIIWFRSIGIGGMLRRLEEKDPVWSPEKIEVRVKDIYFALQDSWRDRDLDRVEHLMEDSLRRKWEVELAEQKRCGKRNMLQDISLESMEVVGVLDQEGVKADRMMALIQGSLVDFMVEEKTGKVIIPEGKKTEAEAKAKTWFWEIWEFSRGPNGNWRLHSISEDTGIFAILNCPCDSTDSYRTWKPGMAPQDL